MSHNKFLSYSGDTHTESKSSIFQISNNRILQQETGDVSIIDLPSTDKYDLLHYYKNIITTQNISFRYEGVELIKAYAQHLQNIQFYQVAGKWKL
jgi:hypothetical protein